MTDIRKEADMGYVKDFVSLIAQALVDATELPAQMEKIKFDMASLADDLTRTKNKNVELDTLLNDTRRQRDEAEQALSQVKAETANTKYSLDEANRSLANSQAGCERLASELAQAKKDRDDYGLKHMAAEDRASEAEGKLKKLREALGMTEEAKPIAPQPVAEPTPVPPAWEPFTPTPEPTPPKRYYEGEAGYEVSKEKWDPVAAKYYSEA